MALQVEEFLEVTMCCPVVQGYGLTETCAASFIALPGRLVSLPVCPAHISAAPAAEAPHASTQPTGSMNSTWQLLVAAPARLPFPDRRTL